jgi:adenine-specific DNA-methyltransferase
MPKLTWIGKDKVINHDSDVPIRALIHNYGFQNGQQSDAPTDSGNKIIHGDNLVALKSLTPQYAGKIKCVYIDPPYNTGNESWVYNDNVNDPKLKEWLQTVVGKEGDDASRHDKWLCMMYPRLKLLHQLLHTEGALFISIDDTEQAHLRLVLDEIFGENNFVGNIIWQKKYTQSNDAKYLSVTHDFILCYAKDKSKFKVNLLSRNEKQLSAYRNPDNDARGVWKATPLTVKTPSDAYIYPIETPSGKVVNPPNGRSWMYAKSRFLEEVAKNNIWFGAKGDNTPAKKSFLSEVKAGVTPKTMWFYDEVGHNHEANEELKGFGLKDFFSTPKPSRLIERIVTMATNAHADDLILDSFAGSGTTAHAVLNLNHTEGGNRKFILIEMEDYAENITAERVKRVITGHGKAEGTEGGFNFYGLK